MPAALSFFNCTFSISQEKEICQYFPSREMEFDGEKDHVHLLIEYRPKIAVSALVNSLKGVSSRLIRKKNYSTITQSLYGKSLWSPSYFAGACGGAALTIIKQYIERQNSPKA